MAWAVLEWLRGKARPASLDGDEVDELAFHRHQPPFDRERARERFWRHPAVSELRALEGSLLTAISRKGSDGGPPQVEPALLARKIRDEAERLARRADMVAEDLEQLDNWDQEVTR